MLTSTLAEQIMFSAVRLEQLANRYVFGPGGLSSVSVKIMRVLERQPGLTPGEIMEAVGGSKSNVTQRLNFLQREGYVQRFYATFAGDKRKISIRLTSRGRQKFRMMDKRSKKAQLLLEKHFSQQELKDFFDFIAKMHQILDQKEHLLAELMKVRYDKQPVVSMMQKASK